MIAAVGLQVAAVYFFNKQRSRQRVTNGKPAVIQDTSMETRYQAYGQEEVHLGQNGGLLRAVTLMCSLAGSYRFQERRVYLCLLGVQELHMFNRRRKYV